MSELSLRAIETGAEAPDFTLPDHRGGNVSLAACDGKYVLLAFHPLAWTPVCAEQMQTLERHMSMFEKFGAVCFGVSVDPVPTKAAWAKHLGLERLRLLSDFWPHGEMAAKYGLLRVDGFSERAVVVLDPQGVVVYVDVVSPECLPDLKQVAFFLKDLTKSILDPNVEIEQCFTAGGRTVCMPDSRNTGIDSTAHDRL